MNRQLELLINLQNIDSEIGGLENSLKKIPLEIEALYSAYQQIAGEISSIKNEIESLNKERRGKEREVEIENDHLSKTKVKLSQVKTNEEYSAILKEMDGIKKKINQLEDEDLSLLELIEEKQNILKEKERKIMEEERGFQDKKSEKEREIEGLKNRFEQKRLERESINNFIDSKISKDYIKVAKNRGGMAVVRFAEGICQGCFLGLPPQLASEIRRNEEIIKCPHCQRVLYWEG